MTTQRIRSGRSASALQREFAAEILLEYLESKNSTLLVDALHHFSKTGDFGPYSPRNQELARRAKFNRLQMHIRRLSGKSASGFYQRIANKHAMSEETAERMIKNETSTKAVLTGSDRLIDYLIDRMADNPLRSSE